MCLTNGLLKNTSSLLKRHLIQCSRIMKEKNLNISLQKPALKKKTVIDIGAGYGRILPQLAPLVKDIIAVEIDSKMFNELKRRSIKYTNVAVIQGDANCLSRLLYGVELTMPVILSLQNSLGTWKGNSKKAIKQMRKIAEQKHGEIIISLFRQKALREYGAKMYKSLKNLVGEIDLKKTEFKKGIFRSKTGYVSKWWTKNEMGEIKKILGGKIMKEILSTSFYILHISYK